MDSYWQSQFRRRMEEFGPASMEDRVPVSIKVRVTSGCFHREHSPKAYEMIDNHLSNADVHDARFRFEEHESGPELLVYLAVTTAGLTFAKSIVELITAIIKARSEGIKKGDRPSDPLELIVRGHAKSGEYYEETVLRIPTGDKITRAQIEDALAKKKPEPDRPRRKSRKKK